MITVKQTFLTEPLGTQFILWIKVGVKRRFDSHIEILEILTSTWKCNLIMKEKEIFQSCRQKHYEICTFNLEMVTINVINNISGKVIDVLWFWVCEMRLDIFLKNMLWLSIWENYIHYRPSDHNGLHTNTMNLFVILEVLAKKNKG